MSQLYEITNTTEGSGEYFTDYAGEALGKHKLVYLAADSKWYLADADSAAKQPILGITLEAIGLGLKGRILTRGYIADISWSWTVGGSAGLIYASTTAGELTQTAPVGFIKTVAIAKSATGIMFDASGPSNGGIISYDPEHTASYIIWVEGSVYYAKNGHTGAVTSNADAYTLLQACVTALSSTKGLIFLKGVGPFTLSDTVDVVASVSIRGEGIATVVESPSGLPAFKYTNPDATINANVMLLSDLTITLPAAGGPHYGVAIDSSVGGSTRCKITNILINGWLCDGTYDKDHVTPHIGIDINNEWDCDLDYVRITMPGICIRTTDYIFLNRCYFDGGSLGNSVGILENAYGALVTMNGVTSEVNSRPLVKSVVASLYAQVTDCHIEGNGWDVDPPEPIFQLDYGAGTGDCNIDLINSSVPAMELNLVNRISNQMFYKNNRDITSDVLIWQPVSIAGAPTITYDPYGIKITAGVGEGTVDLYFLSTSYVGIMVGGKVAGEGEIRFTAFPYTDYLAIQVDAAGNLNLVHKSAAINETQEVSADTHTIYDIVGFINTTSTQKNIVYSVNNSGIYTSKIVTFTDGLGYIDLNTIRAVVPAGKTFYFYPRIWKE